MALTYVFTEGSRIAGVTAQIVGERLAILTEKYGMIQPRDVVQDAKPVTSPLHKAFEWDNTKAAQAHREAQARNLITSFRIVTPSIEVNGAMTAQRVFVNAKVGAKQGYITTARAMGDPELRAQVLGEAKKELGVWRTRYNELQALAELAPVFEAINTTLDGTQATTKSRRSARAPRAIAATTKSLQP